MYFLLLILKVTSDFQCTTRRKYTTVFFYHLPLYFMGNGVYNITSGFFCSQKIFYKNTAKKKIKFYGNFSVIADNFSFLNVNPKGYYFYEVYSLFTVSFFIPHRPLSQFPREESFTRFWNLDKHRSQILSLSLPESEVISSTFLKLCQTCIRGNWHCFLCCNNIYG